MGSIRHNRKKRIRHNRKKRTVRHVRTQKRQRKSKTRRKKRKVSNRKTSVKTKRKVITQKGGFVVPMHRRHVIKAVKGLHKTAKRATRIARNTSFPKTADDVIKALKNS